MAPAVLPLAALRRVVITVNRIYEPVKHLAALSA